MRKFCHSLFVLNLVIFLVNAYFCRNLVTVQQVTNADWACLVSESLYYETLKVEHRLVTMRK